VRFGLIHRIMTDALAALGLLALVSSGELNRWITISIVVGLLAALAVPERWQDKIWLRQLGVVAPIALLVAQITRLVFGASVLGLAVEFAAALQVVRLATRRGAAHDQQVIVLALLHLIAGTVLGGGLAYGLCFLGFLVVAPGALVLSHLRREVEGNYRQGARDRTGLPVDVPRILRSRRVIGKQFLAFTCLLSVPIFLFTAVLFVMFPRVGLSLLLLNHARPERMIGFSDKVDLGGVGKLRSDPTIAMRIEYPDLPAEPPPRLALYLRGTAFDQYNGRSWSRSQTHRTPAQSQAGQVKITRFAATTDRKLTIDLEPIDPPVLFLPPDAVAMRLLSRGTPLLGGSPSVVGGPEGEFKYASIDDRGVRYEVFLAGASEPPPRPLEEGGRRYLTLPEPLPARVAELARSWVGAETDPGRQAKIIETRLRKDYKYDLESPSGAAENPLDHFLFESKRGHCEFYSTAMAVLLRTLPVPVPTRNVTGFIGGTYNRFGRYYAVRQGDAHSWVEVYLETKGWTRFDPTPPSDAAPQSEISGALAFVRDFVEAAAQRWNRNVVGYDLKQQVHLLRSMRERYSEIRGSSELVGGALGSPRRIALGVGGLVLLALGVYWLRRQRRSMPPARERATVRDLGLSQIVALYRQLDAAMTARAIGRPQSTPPLAHARALCEMGHPAGAEILELTRLYVEVRFGGRTLTDEQRRDYARRVKALRLARDEVPHAA
jgi:protein-glutamine gamma-glutamyltransferase